MNQTLQQYQSGSGLVPSGQTPLAKSTQRALSGLQQQAAVSTAQIQVQQYLGGQAMFAVAELSEWEAQLAMMCPLATSRLEFIANTTTMSIARTLNRFG